MVVKMSKNKTQAAQNAAKEIEQQLTNGIAAAVQCITVTGKPSTGQANQYYKYKNYTKTKPIRCEEFELEKSWWNNREENEYAWNKVFSKTKEDSIGELTTFGIFFFLLYHII